MSNHNELIISCPSKLHCMHRKPCLKNIYLTLATKKLNELINLSGWGGGGGVGWCDGAG